MSSLVVRLLEVRYVWNPARPMMDQTLKKQITQTIKLGGDSLTAYRKLLFSGDLSCDSRTR